MQWVPQLWMDSHEKEVESAKQCQHVDSVLRMSFFFENYTL